MSIDRAVLAFAGTVVLVSLLLSQVHHPGWLWLTAFVGANLLPWTLLLAVSAGALRDAGDPGTGQDSSIIR